MKNPKEYYSKSFITTRILIIIRYFSYQEEKNKIQKETVWQFPIKFNITYTVHGAQHCCPEVSTLRQKKRDVSTEACA